MAGVFKSRQGGKRAGFALWVRVRPRSREDSILGWTDDGYLGVQVRAAPVRGAANESCCSQLASALNVAPSLVRVERGHASSRKKIRVEGVSEEEGLRLLGHPRGAKGG